jgi:hypothetical protein
MILSNVRIIYNIQHNQQVVSMRRVAIERQMIFMMMASVMVFLLTTLPYSIYEILMGQVFINYDNFLSDNQYYMFIHRMIGHLNSSHFASNFYLHCLTSRVFRTEFIRRITCGKIDRR